MTIPGFDPRQDLGSWSVVAGDPLTITVNVKKPDGTGLDLTTYGTTWAAVARESPSQAPATTLSVNSTSASSGTLVLSLTGTQTSTMATDVGDATSYRFDLQVTGGTVTPQTPFTGHLTVWKVH